MRDHLVSARWRRVTDAAGIGNSGWCLVSRDGETTTARRPALRLLRYPIPRADCQLMPSVLDLDLELHCACVLITHVTN